MHRVGNHLQAIRGELELLRMSGDLPERTFESVICHIDALHALAAELGTLTHQINNERSLGDSLRRTVKRRNRAHSEK
jgi:hypothetical protein